MNPGERIEQRVRYLTSYGRDFQQLCALTVQRHGADSWQARRLSSLQEAHDKYLEAQRNGVSQAMRRDVEATLERVNKGPDRHPVRVEISMVLGWLLEDFAAP